jgi:hypothetical protein
VLPNRLIIQAYAVRGFKLWLLTRLAIGLVGLFGGQTLAPDSAVVSFYIVLICAAVNVAEIKRRHERALLGNLGLTRAHLATLFVAPAIVGELLIFLGTLPLR